MTTDETLQHLVNATHSALCEHGYAELTMQDIADESDVSKSALHYHFDCKHDLLLSFLDHLYEGFEERIADPAGEDPAERLLSLVETVLLPPGDDGPQEFRTALLEIEAQAPYDDAYRTRLRRFDDAFADRARSIIAAGVDDGTFRADVDPDAAASFVVTHVRGARTENVAVGTPLDDLLASVERYVETTLLADAAEVGSE